MKRKNYRYNYLKDNPGLANGCGIVDCDQMDDESGEWWGFTLSPEDSENIISSDIDIAPYFEPEKSIPEQIQDIEDKAESLKTRRLKREAALGLDYKPGQTAAGRLIEIDREADEKIAELRKQL